MTPQQKALQDCIEALEKLWLLGDEAAAICNPAITQAKQALEPQAQGEAKADCLCGRYEFCPDCEPGLFGEVQPTITSSESRSPIAHLRARTSQHKWNSYELCQADDPNGIAVYTHPQASEPQAQGKVLQGLAAYLRCEAGGVFVGSPNYETLMQWAREVDAVRNPQASEPEVWVVENKVMQMFFWSEAEARKATPNTATSGINVRRLHVFGAAPEEKK
jgi:hypothetical protein